MSIFKYLPSLFIFSSVCSFIGILWRGYCFLNILFKSWGLFLYCHEVFLNRNVSKKMLVDFPCHRKMNDSENIGHLNLRF